MIFVVLEITKTYIFDVATKTQTELHRYVIITRRNRVWIVKKPPQLYFVTKCSIKNIFDPVFNT